MHRGAVLHVLPWLLLVVGLAIALRLLTRLAGGTWAPSDSARSTPISRAPCRP